MLRSWAAWALSLVRRTSSGLGPGSSLGWLWTGTTDANEARLGDDCAASHVVEVILGEQSTQGGFNQGRPLVIQAHHEHPGVLPRRVTANVGEPSIQREEHSAFPTGSAGHSLIVTPRQAFLSHRHCIVAVATQDWHHSLGNVLVNFDLH